MITSLPMKAREDVLADLKAQGFCIGLMNPEEYHATKKLLPLAVSKSKLTNAIDGIYRYKHAADVEASKVMKSGSLVDCLVLTPELFEAQYMRFPKRVSLATKEGKAIKANAAEAGKEICWDDAEEMVAAANAKATLERELGAAYLTQVAMWVNLPIDGVNVVVSGMIDMLPHDPMAYGIYDLKTTSTQVDIDSKLFKHMSEYHYGIQAAMYIDLLRECGYECADYFSFLFVERKLPCCTRVVRMLPEDIERYRRIYLTLLEEVARATESGEWGSFELAPVDFVAPRWEESDFERKGF